MDNLIKKKISPKLQLLLQRSIFLSASPGVPSGFTFLCRRRPAFNCNFTSKRLPGTATSRHLYHTSSRPTLRCPTSSPAITSAKQVKILNLYNYNNNTRPRPSIFKMARELTSMRSYTIAHYNVDKHIIPAFPIREHPRGTWNGDDKLQIVVNHYKPIDNPTPKSGDLTLILSHANGFHKELYEPFLDYLLEDYEKKGVKLRGVWVADMHCQGESGVLNEKKLGGDVSWFDHSRDLMSMIMHFPNDIVQPVAGIGHSMGGAQLFRLSLMHPTLFTCVIGIDPVISPVQAFPGHANPAAMSAKRRDIWPSREAAIKFFKSRPFYQSWDSRCLDLHMQYGLRQVPTAVYPDVTKVEGGENAVTLTTTKHQEVFTFFRSSIQDRTDPKDMFRMLPELKVPVCYIQGETSVVNWGNNNELKMQQTPQPCEMHIIKGCGHLVPLEKPKEAAEIAAEFLYRRLKVWGKQIEEQKALLEPSLVIKPDYFDAKRREAKM